MLANVDAIALPEPIGALSTKRLLTMTWLDGHPLTDFLSAAQETRNRIATLLFRAWWTPMGQYGIIHGDPHLGNYSFAGDADQLNLLDLGCVRVFSPTFVDGVLKLRSGLEHDDADLIEEAYTLWGFAPLDAQIIDALNIWARFLYAPLLDRRVRKATGDVDPSEYGRREIIEMKRRLMAAARPVTIPREFVLLDRAVIGLGAAFLHLRAELNFAALFDACIEGFSPQTLGVRQDAALGHAGLA
jgi:predicted unusual protein kinase regulating ubiquinone biosynthesis (AarF/ABC1/UbiB family)